MTTLFNYLVLSGIFTSGFILFQTPFVFYINYIVMLGYLAFYLVSGQKIYVSKIFLFILLVFSLLSLLNVFMGNNSFFSLTKQVFGFVLNGGVYYILIRSNKNNIDKLIHVYLKLATFVAAIGIFQEISFMLGFVDGYDYSYFIPNLNPGGNVLGMLRISSILPEPAHFGAAMAPAIFISTLNIIKNETNFIGRKVSLLIFLSALLTFSLITYVGIIVSLFLIMANYKRVKLMVITVSALGLFSFFSYKYLPEIKTRIDDTFGVIAGTSAMVESNLSTFAFVSNAGVAFKSFESNPLFGSGIGSHSLSYAKYIYEVIDSNQSPLMLCKDDAGSLFFRLVSEAGLFGVVGFFYFIVHFYISRKRDRHLWIISNSIVCLFVMNLIRLGNFFYCGFMFFVWIYYLASKSPVARTTVAHGEQSAKNTLGKQLIT